MNRLLAAGQVLATARTVPEGGNPEQFIQADGSTREGADHIIRRTFDRLGGLDILINSVGGSSAPGGGVLALTDADWQQEFELNLFSAVRLDRGFLPAMLKQGSGSSSMFRPSSERSRCSKLPWATPPPKLPSPITAKDSPRKSARTASA